MEFHEGDRVTYLQVTPGGYGFASHIPAIVVRRTPRRIRIRVTLRDGGTKEIAVDPANLRPRADEFP